MVCLAFEECAITVHNVLGWPAHGMTEEALEEHPELEKRDFAAVYAFAAEMTARTCSHR